MKLRHIAALALTLCAFAAGGQADIATVTEKWIAPDNTVATWYDTDDASCAVDGASVFNVGKTSGGEDIFAFLRVPMRATWLADEFTDTRLYLHVNKGASQLKIGLVSRSWDLLTTRDEARALVDDDSVTARDVRDEGDGWISLDVTDCVRAWLSGDAQNCGFALFGDTDGAIISIDADDSPNGSNNYAYLRVTGAEGERALTYGKFAYTRQPVNDDTPEDEAGNCMAYALRDTNAILDEHLGIDANLMKEEYASGGKDAVAEYTAGLVEKYVRDNADGLMISSFRRIDSYDAPIDAAREYRIAMRVGCLPDDDGSFDNGNSYDYHFWAQLNDGRWAQKFPLFSSDIIPGTYAALDPAKFPWDGSSNWYMAKNHDFDDSKAIYYAVTKDTNEFTAHRGE